jgi:FKBP-type peptidyl-prolyl cis-trans isomerase (trigger factor)
MSTSTINKLPKSTVELTVSIPWSDVKITYDSVFKKVAGYAELSGFRKGKAPKKIVEENVDKQKLYEEVVRQIIPQAIADALKQHTLSPVTPPQVTVEKAKENEDWVIIAKVALRPVINLKQYKDKIKEIKKLKVKIWTPGTKEEDKKKEEKVSLDEIINTLLNEVEVEISDLLISQEANRLLSDLVDQTQKLGMTVEQYLLAKGKTSEQLRSEYALQAQKNLAVEFILAEIAEKEKITVQPAEIEALITKVEKPEEREKLRKDSYYLAHLIRQQKTLDFLSNL